MEFINGESRGQRILFPDCIDDCIRENNAARVIEAYVNSLDMAALGCGRPEPSAAGRPVYDPKDLLKRYLYGYMSRIRSSRWRNGEMLKNVFKGFVKLRAKPGLYGKELAVIDGSRFKG